MMNTKTSALHTMVDMLQGDKLDIIYLFASQLLTDDEEFDTFTPEQSTAIMRSFDEIKRGECLHFDNAAEVLKYFASSGI
jgi:hypothetical protein